MKLRSIGPIAAAIFVLGGCSQPTSNQNTVNVPIAIVTPDPNATPPPETLAAGKELYMSNCAACHREDGKGGRIEIEGKSIKPDDLTSEKIKGFADDKLYGYIYNGIEDEGMPSFKDDLSEAEIREVVRFVRVEIQKVPEGFIAKPGAK